MKWWNHGAKNLPSPIASNTKQNSSMKTEWIHKNTCWLLTYRYQKKSAYLWSRNVHLLSCNLLWWLRHMLCSRNSDGWWQSTLTFLWFQRFVAKVKVFYNLQTDRCAKQMKVSEIQRVIKGDGWRLITIRRNHRQFRYAFKSGRAVVQSKLGDDLAIGTQNSVLKQVSLKWSSMYYTVVIKKEIRNYSVCMSDLAWGAAACQAMRTFKIKISEATARHIEGMIENGLPLSPQVGHVE